MDNCFFALSLVTDGGKKLVPIGQHFTKLDKFVLFEETKNSLWKGKRKVLLLHIMSGYQCDKAMTKNDTREVI